MKTKPSQIEAVEAYMKKAITITPSHLSLDIEGRKMSYETFCRNLRRLAEQGKLVKRDIAKGRKRYEYIDTVRNFNVIDEFVEIPGFEGTSEALKNLTQSRLP